MKRAFLLILFVALLQGCAKPPPPPVTNTEYFDIKLWDLTLALVNNSTKKVKRVAVLEFKNPDGQTSQLGKYLSTKFSTIAVMRQLFVIPAEGEVIEAMKKEKIVYNGALDRDAAKKLGDALGVEGLIVGVLSDLQKGSDIDLIVTLIEVRSGNIISSANTDIIRSPSVNTMMQSF